MVVKGFTEAMEIAVNSPVRSSEFKQVLRLCPLIF